MNKKNIKENLILIFNRIFGVVVALLIWQLAATRIHQRILLVTPLQVATRLTTIWQVQGFFDSIWFTFYHIVYGFFVGLLVGIILAILAYRFKLAKTLLWPWMATIKAVPVASFVVICLIWLTADNLSVFISFLIVVPVVYHNILTGLSDKDKKLNDMATVYKLSKIRIIRYITLPQIAPYLLSACQVTIGMAWKAGVAAEIIGTPNGSIGRQLFLAKMYLDTDDLLAWTVIIVVLSVSFEKLFMMVLRRIINAI